MSYEINDNLTTLSGSEKQRILLAHFFVYSAQFGILDEITAGLDIKTIRNIEEKLDEELCGYIYVSHRLDSGIMHHVNKIILVENMKIVGMGSPAEMMGHVEKLIQ
ncbi:hypothetical protein ACFQY8_07915 [Alloscardovia venturai]|uniref:ABC transporter domain-containing protein n=1 Tax=Alloscardovia venturai TaxID=1769421 RepID=A0ABW2YAQ0_9BIFI